ncbi:MAG: RNA-binding protein [Parcubacteria group bacterium Gr01-1014_19]|nr:MAG: RNA-binding protein [Parcubacteria group bacterium Gr01-1014_19]
MAKKLYVGNLPYSANDESLKETFSAAGSVESANVIMDRMTGRSRGFGFVEMSTDEDAQKAIEMFNGKDMGGRALTVNEAKPMESRAPRG